MDHVFEDRVVVEIILHLLGDGDDDSDDEEEETDDTNDTSKEQVGDGKPKTIYQKLEKIKEGYAGKVFSRHTDGTFSQMAIKFGWPEDVQLSDEVKKKIELREKMNSMDSDSQYQFNLAMEQLINQGVDGAECFLKPTVLWKADKWKNVFEHVASSNNTLQQEIQKAIDKEKEKQLLELQQAAHAQNNGGKNNNGKRVADDQTRSLTGNRKKDKKNTGQAASTSSNQNNMSN